jgi:predicted O-linked N-acetylglucosamine transferase (SPINDLY family)
VAGRAGFSQASNLGLTELVARTPEEYISTASSLAGDLPRLAELRASLRGRMMASPLCDAVGWTRGIEAAYRRIWQQWCQAGTRT